MRLPHIFHRWSLWSEPYLPRFDLYQKQARICKDCGLYQQRTVY